MYLVELTTSYLGIAKRKGASLISLEPMVRVHLPRPEKASMRLTQAKYRIISEFNEELAIVKEPEDAVRVYKVLPGANHIVGSHNVKLYPVYPLDTIPTVRETIRQITRKIVERGNQTWLERRKDRRVKAPRDQAMLRHRGDPYLDWKSQKRDGYTARLVEQPKVASSQQ